MKSAPKAVKREEEAQISATILPFRLRADRFLSAAAEAKAPKLDIAANTTQQKAKRAKKGANAEIGKAERPTFLIPRYRGWLKQAIIASVLLHVIAFAFFQIRFIADVERAANTGNAASSEGAVIEIDIVADANIAPSKTPTPMTDPEAKTTANRPPQEEQKEDQLEQKAQPAPAPNNAPQLALPKEEQAPPQKADDAPTPQSPNQLKTEEQQKPDVREIPKQKSVVQKKKQEQATPSAAAAPTRAARAVTASYNGQVIAHLRRFQSYPEAARSAGIRGASTVNFRLARNGAVVAVSLSRSSGNAILDQAAVAMVRRASPFPPIPADYEGNGNFTAPVQFNLR
jgi:protein TonB